MNSEKLVQSRYFHIFKKNGVTALYHSLNLQTLYLDNHLAHAFDIFKKLTSPRNFLNSIPDQYRNNAIRLIEQAKNIGILISNTCDDDNLLRKHQDYYLKKPQIGILYLVLTLRCNLECKYCFLKPSLLELSAKSYDMDLNTVAESIKAYGRNLSSNASRKTIILYGGEPLLNKKAIEFVLEKVSEMKFRNELPQDLAITINTNATVVTKDICKLFKKYDVAVSVSLDGPKEIHDKNRIKFNGEGSFSDTISGFYKLKEAGVQTGISCTVTSDIIDYLPEITNWFIKDLKADFLGFNPLTYTKPKQSIDPIYAKRYTSALIRSFKTARNLGCYEDRMMRKIESFVKGEIYPFDCAGCGRQMVVAPDGQIGVCHAYLDSRRYFCNCKLENFIAKKENHWLEWCHRSPIGMNECVDCIALGICGGGCPHNSDLSSGSIWALDEFFCIYSRNVLEWMIWDVWENLNENFSN